MLGRYTLTESVPVPGYDPDLFVETFEITTNDRFHVATHIFFNTWSKRAFVGSTLALRLAYLEQIGLAEAELTPEQLAQNGGGRFGVALHVGEDAYTGNATMTHAATGILVGEGEAGGPFDVVTTDLDEHLTIQAMPNHFGELTVDTAGGNDVIDVDSTSFDALDAGEGEDVLRLMADGTYELADFVDRIRGVEQIALAGEGEQQIMLDRVSVNAASTDGTLRVRTQRSGQLATDGSWTVGAPIRVGDDVVQVLTSGSTVLHVTNEATFQNVLNRFDVDGSGGATALDALQIINGLSRGEGESVANGELTNQYFDVNGDGIWSALDALQIINRLGSGAVGEGEQVAATNDSSPAGLTDAALAQSQQGEVLDSTAESVANFEVSSGQVWSEQAVGQAFHDDSEDVSSEEFESALLLLASDLGR